MSKAHTLEIVDLSALASVHGGLEVRGRGRVNIGPGTGTVEGDFEYRRTNYESCVNAVTSRPRWTPQQLKDACGRPPS